jgi:O-antigen ligase
MTAIIGALLLFPQPDDSRIFMKRVAVGAGMFVCLVGLLATGSRTMLLLTLATLALVLAVSLRVSLRGLLAQKLQVAGLMLVTLVGGLGVAMLAPQLFGDTLQRLEELTVNPPSLFNRFVFAFRDTVPILEAHPIIGVGNGTLILSIGRMWPESRVLLLPAHNVYVFVWAELGVIGVFLLLMGLLGALTRLHRRNGLAVVVMSALLLAICVAMVFDFYFWGDVRSRALLFWVLGMGWGYALPDQSDPAS